MGRIYKCVNCGRYTLKKDRCMHCGGELKSAHPPNISLQSKILSLIIKERRKVRES
ncbi:MAG: nucleolar RNA-binding Nop10p family protein [Nitrososphaerota archaeon]